ncbi:MAG: efflux RND transporter periplasmic adaptor subunit [Thiomonas sp.]|uniref:efflux RND transporter periplasmic adaptor subunit n=1 Tax=Thiomonas sp. TaxID=2047785 RepID=UPI002A3664B1|nr:efflux RND transporter periplasmic adaptor subunit [Thiomonas sp.]MDY0331038.1 efflux RND transporter periplasmic adaptor subunit [Thiomonas sp.]
MNFSALNRRTLLLLAVLVPLLILLGYVALRTGPLAPVPVTVATVQDRAIAPSLFGIGTVQARYTTLVGPTVAGRVKRLDVHVGDSVRAGQVLGEMDPVDLDARIRSQQATVLSTQAQLRQAQTQRDFARTQATRYAQLFAAHGTTEELLATREQELQSAEAALQAAHDAVERARADLAALQAQRSNLKLVAPTAGLVSARDADPGSTVVAGAAVVELIAPDSLWIDTRFDQLTATGLAAGLPARIVLRSRSNQTLAGRVLRVDPVADAVTEETLAKVVFDPLPQPLPPIGELADVTVSLPALPARPTVPNASLQRVDGKLGVWRVASGKLEFVPVKVLGSDLQGDVQVQGLKAGERVVVYSQRTLGARSNISIVDHIPGVSP